jgi:hypothetical protein
MWLNPISNLCFVLNWLDWFNLPSIKRWCKLFKFDIWCQRNLTHICFFIGWRVYEGVVRKGDFITNVNTGKTFEVSLSLLIVLVDCIGLVHMMFCVVDLLLLFFAMLPNLCFLLHNLFIFDKCMTQFKITFIILRKCRFLNWLGCVMMSWRLVFRFSLWFLENFCIIVLPYLF